MSRTRTLVYETRSRDGLSLADLAELVSDVRGLVGQPASNYPLRDLHPVVTLNAPRTGYSPPRPAGIRRIKVTL